MERKRSNNKEVKHKPRERKLSNNEIRALAYENSKRAVINTNKLGQDHLNMQKNQVIADQKLDQIMNNQKILDKKFNWLRENARGETLMKEMDRYYDLGDVLGEQDYQAEVERKEASRLAELEESNKARDEGQKETDERPVDPDAGGKDGSRKDPKNP